MDAIHANKPHLKVEAENRKLSTLDTSDYDQFSSQMFHKTTTNYEFAKDVTLYSLDTSMHADSIEGVSEDSLLHCPVNEKHHASVGDIFVASTHGKSVHSKEHGHLGTYMRSESVLRNQGFLLLRRVVSKSTVSSNEKTCSSYVTEDVHPIELFHSFHIDSEAESPFETEYSSVSPQAIQATAPPFIIPAFPDAPLKSCSDPYFKYDQDDFFSPALIKGSGKDQGSGGSYLYTAHLTYSCAQ
jgi:hypothetical protein